jgi:serine/threonine protein kinase
VATTETEDSPSSLCPTCGKPLLDNKRRGSLTSFLFGASFCSCASNSAATPPPPPALHGEVHSNSNLCPKCSLEIDGKSRKGSLTAFLFRFTRCQCPANDLNYSGKMSARLSKLKQADCGTLFIRAASQSGQQSKSAIDLAPGATIGGAYKIIKLIGRGGTGEVYLASHEALGKKCALKVIAPEEVTQLGWLRFQREAKVLAALEHINIVRVTDLGIHDGCLPYYAMHYVQGQSLAEILAESGPLPLPAVLDIFTQVCRGVDYAHCNGIIHRDLKPANIMVAKTKGDKLEAKILDFGLAKLIKQDKSDLRLSASGDIFGSPFYMSPEQCNGEKLDRRTDIYSLGCTIFECLIGQPPFPGDLATDIIFSHMQADPPTLASVAGESSFPSAMEDLIAKLLRKNADERCQTLAEVGSVLEKVMKEENMQVLDRE